MGCEENEGGMRFSPKFINAMESLPAQVRWQVDHAINELLDYIQGRTDGVEICRIEGRRNLLLARTGGVSLTLAKRRNQVVFEKFEVEPVYRLTSPHHAPYHATYRLPSGRMGRAMVRDVPGLIEQQETMEAVRREYERRYPKRRPILHRRGIVCRKAPFGVVYMLIKMG